MNPFERAQYQSPQWRRLRAEVIARAGGRCDDERSATPMMEHHLVQKEADSLNMNLIDLVCP